MTDFNVSTVQGTDNTITGGVSSPALLTASVNDFAPGACHTMLLSSNGSYNITGLAAGVAGQIVRVVNTTAFTLTLKHQSSSSVAANRFMCSTGADVALTQHQGVPLVYDAVAAVWRVFN